MFWKITVTHNLGWKSLESMDDLHLHRIVTQPVTSRSQDSVLVIIIRLLSLKIILVGSTPTQLSNIASIKTLMKKPFVLFTSIPWDSIDICIKWCKWCFKCMVQLISWRGWQTSTLARKQNAVWLDDRRNTTKPPDLTATSQDFEDVSHSFSIIVFYPLGSFQQNEKLWKYI